MLIVEGSDLVGKTTLCKKLTEILSRSGHIYSHFTRLPDAFDRYWGYVERASPNIVQDRFHMSEIVYAEARGDAAPRALGPEEYRLVDGHLRSLGVFTIVVTVQDDELLRTRYRDSEMYDLETVKRVNGIFNQIVRGIGWKEFNPDFDMHIACSTQHPFPNDGQIATIFKRYHKRRECLLNTLRRRPTV